MNTLRNALCTRVDKCENDPIIPMRLEFHMHELSLTYFHQGVLKTERNIQHKWLKSSSFYWSYDIDAKELHDAILKVGDEHELVYSDGKLTVIGNSQEIPITAYQWGEELKTFLSYDPETDTSFYEVYFSFSVDNNNFRRGFLAAARTAQFRSDKVYMQTVRASKTLSLTTFAPTQLSFHACFSLQEPKSNMHFAIPAQVIRLFEDEDSAIQFNFCTGVKKVWLVARNVMACFDWDDSIPPSLDALPERATKSITVDREAFADAIKSVAETISLTGTLILENPNANHVHLIYNNSQADSILLVNGKKGVQKLPVEDSPKNYQSEIVVCAIALTDILQNMSSPTIRLKLPLNRATPLTIQANSEMYQLFGIESEPFNGSYQDISLFRPQPNILYRADNEDGSELKIICVEESLLEPRLSLDEFCDQIDSILTNEDTSAPERIKYHLLMEQCEDFHYVLIELYRRLEVLFQDDPNPVVQGILKQLLTRRIASDEIIHRSKIDLARNGELKISQLETHLEDVIWFAGQISKVLTKQNTSYQLAVIV